MKPILIINTDLGWDNVTCILDAEKMTEDQHKRVKEACESRSLILIDWQSITSVESFLLDYE